MATIDEALALAEQHYQAGQLAEAEQVCRQILQTGPAHPRALHLLGLLAGQARRWDEAIASYQEALRLRPDFAEVHNSLGRLLFEQGRPAEALPSFQEAVHLCPDFPEAHANLGDAFHLLGRWQEAEASYRTALRLRPNSLPAHNNLGALLTAQGQFAQSEALFRDAVRRWPESAEAHYNLGIALAAQQKPDEALACYEQVLRLQPDYAEALNNTAIIYKKQGRAEEAVAAARKAAACRPDLPYLHSNLLLALHYLASYDPETTFAEHLRWGQQFGMAPSRQRALFPLQRDPDRRLRIGYVSGDFRDHVMGRYCEGVLGAHDLRRFEIFCYSTLQQEDERTQRIREVSDHWRCIAPLTDGQAARSIRNDQIDLLVDLSGHSAGSRLGVFAHGPAPIQVSHFGYPASTGLAAIDYRLTDVYSDPPGMTEHLHSEKLVRMPEACWCYVPWGPPHKGYDPLYSRRQAPCSDANADISPLPAERAGAVTFACVSTLGKVTEDILALWSHILKELPEARMLMVTGTGSAGDERVRRTFGSHGIGPERVTLVGRRKIDAYLRLFHEVDIVLDTYPYTGCNTTADALWMGVPVISRAGRSCVSRLAVSALVLTGLQDLLAESSSAYVEAAVGLARDLARLRELRVHLRDRVRRTLGNVERFTRQLEVVYRDLWRTYCALK
jgi:predicted O-linked N-acetylglucosamine transferase (SPINDLY family)